jgi:hypothetical protein
MTVAATSLLSLDQTGTYSMDMKEICSFQGATFGTCCITVFHIFLNDSKCTDQNVGQATAMGISFEYLMLHTLKKKIIMSGAH